MGKDSSRENFSERSNVSAISVTIWKAFIQPSEKSPFSSGYTSKVFLQIQRFACKNRGFPTEWFCKLFSGIFVVQKE